MGKRKDGDAAAGGGKKKQRFVHHVRHSSLYTAVKNILRQHLLDGTVAYAVLTPERHASRALSLHQVACIMLTAILQQAYATAALCVHGRCAA